MWGYAVMGLASAPALVVRLRNLDEVVAKQGGAAGAAVNAILPEVVAAQAYAKMRDKLLAGFRAQGVDADVQVTSAPPVGPPPRSDFPVGPPPRSDFYAGAVAGVLGVGGAYALWRYVLRGIVHRALGVAA